MTGGRLTTMVAAAGRAAVVLVVAGCTCFALAAALGVLGGLGGKPNAPQTASRSAPLELIDTAGYNYGAAAALATASPSARNAAFRSYDAPAQPAGASIAASTGRLAAEGFGGVIKGYTRHGLAQAMGRDAGRGVSPKAILNAVKSPISKTVQADGSTIYKGANATVIVNKDGRVITTWATNSSGVRGAP